MRGDLNRLEDAGLETRHFMDLVEGAQKGTVLYLRMAEWAIRPSSLASVCDRGALQLDRDEEERIRSFNMTELDGTASVVAPS